MGGGCGGRGARLGKSDRSGFPAACTRVSSPTRQPTPRQRGRLPFRFVSFETCVPRQYLHLVTGAGVVICHVLDRGIANGGTARRKPRPASCQLGKMCLFPHGRLRREGSPWRTLLNGGLQTIGQLLCAFKSGTRSLCNVVSCLDQGSDGQHQGAAIGLFLPNEVFHLFRCPSFLTRTGSFPARDTQPATQDRSVQNQDLSSHSPSP